MEFNTVSVKSKFLRFPIMLLGVTTNTINVLWTDIISPPAQVEIYFGFMIPSCSALQLTLIKCI